jgi:hypothetical protein
LGTGSNRTGTHDHVAESHLMSDTPTDALVVGHQDADTANSDFE